MTTRLARLALLSYLRILLASTRHGRHPGFQPGYGGNTKNKVTDPICKPSSLNRHCLTYSSTPRSLCPTMDLLLFDESIVGATRLAYNLIPNQPAIEKRDWSTCSFLG
ncbi:hypothetical protein BJX99DRAFT_229817 [Aspergillus californicus]